MIQSMFRYATRLHNTRKFCVLMIGFAIVSGPVFSADPIPAKIAKSLDTDKNGKISLAEFLAGKNKVQEQRRLFFQYDANEDLNLSFDELKVKSPNPNLKVTNRFRYQDQNIDGKLTLKEYMASIDSTNPKLAQRNFKVVDFDRNGHLTLEEYKALPGLLPVAERGVIPDPVAELAATALGKWKALQKAADENADNQLSLKEWPLKVIQKQLTPLADIKFTTWDIDKNGQVTNKEAEQLIAVAYGMQHVNGASMRSVNGQVLYRSYISQTDKDQDHRLSKAEYLPSIRLPKKQVQDLFAKMDADKNDFLTYQELATSSLSNIDEFSSFLRNDQDLDGLVSPAELLKAGLNGITELRLSQGMAAFDQDKDGKFSLREYRMAPIGCSYVTVRVYGRRDQNHDGMLSWQEFYQEPSPQVIGLAWELFRRFDRNQNGQLELSEFEFQIDFTKLSPKLAFEVYDKNADGELALKEYLILVAGTTNPELAQRNFKVVDFDVNGRLSLAEYQALPGLLPVSERGAIPDPIAEFASAAQKKWQTLQKAADKDADGQISLAEWPQAELQKQLTPLADVKFTVWDADQNGQISSKEAKLLIDIAYGMRHVNGAPLRATNGMVLYRYYIKQTDKDGDNRLSKAEYLPSIRLPPEQVLDLFTKMDADEDGFLTYEELATSSLSNLDEFSAFLRYDQDLDGFLSPDELLKVGSNSTAKTNLDQGLTAFDEDGDGKFSLREFRLAPVGYSYVMLRVYGRKDLDNNGTLSWKEFYQEPSPQLVGLAWELFRRFDRNQNNQLESSEFEFRVDPTKLSPHDNFTFRDINTDGELTLEEYLPIVASTNPKLAKRNFKLVDFDGNGQLTLEEYKALPGIFSVANRGAIPDPVAELATAAQQKWLTLHKAADKNADGQLSKAEWPLEQIQKLLPPLADIKFTVWDADQNSQVTSKEAEQLIAVAYGMQHLNGFPLRATNGFVLYRFYINRTDKDGDHRISLAEYLPSIRLPKEKVQTQFKEIDSNKDGFLTYQELTNSRTTNIDEFNFFLSRDKDLDGFLSREELLEVGTNGSAKTNLNQGMTAFDEDKDGKFSLREFRLAPIGSIYVTLRVYDRRDLDHDGVLSWQEFYQEPTPQVIGLAWELFQRFDLNKNGTLELNEFEFRVDPTKLSPKTAFTISDRNTDGELTLEEYLPLVSSTKPEQARHNFNFIDFNNNRTISFEEYQALPGLLPVPKRGPIPDPVAELALTAQKKWMALQKAADQNADGKLSKSEWPLKDIKKQLTPLADIHFKVWDTDQNGQVTSKEASKLISVAYGMQHVNGSPLRAANGLVIYRSHFIRSDKDGDHRLSQDEFRPSTLWSKEKIQAQFTKLDTDQDGFLNCRELATLPLSNIDELNIFLSIDKDKDRFLSSKELLNFGLNGVTELRLSQGFAAFDKDRDNKISLREFRLAPVGCCYVTLDVYNKRDLNYDGKLSWQEFYQEKSPQVIGLAWELFQSYDRNQNGQLELNEFEFRVDLSKLSPENAFSVYDKNLDGELTIKEYLLSVAATNHKLAQRNFKVVDFDGSGQLTLEEYKALPGLFPVAKRGAIPDPVAELATAALQKWQILQKTADQNVDGQLSQTEWPLEELKNQLTPLADVEFKVWDADQNGQITSKEAEQLIAIAYGMQHVNQAPLRTTNGLVLYRFYISRTDKDGDHRLSKAEYLPSTRLPKEHMETQFTELDKDQDGFLTYQELTNSTSTNIDEFNYFLSSDKDLDGQLSLDELLKVGSNSTAKNSLAQGFAAFDENNDGKFSLREFRLAPVGISYVTLRVYDRQDLNHDGTLSWQEFYHEKSPQLIGLAWELFQRFDRNRNGKLELNEFEFRIDHTKLSPQIAFDISDKNSDGEITLEEYLPSVATTKPQLAQRNFKLVDFNKNNQLNLEEYKAIPGLFPLEERGAIPDPVADLANAAQQKWQTLKKTADKNSDGQLSKAEWPQAGLQQQLTPLSSVKFSVWDTDQNGQVSPKEAEQLIAVAYGMQHVNGAPLRTTNGLVLYRSYFKTTDKDGDHRLSLAEYLPSIRLPKEQVESLFTDMDNDQNGYLTYQELTTSSTTNIDEYSYFLNTDKDLDGFLSPDELIKINSNGVVEQRLPQGFAAFDEDGDGKFSLREFRLAPVGCSYVTLRVYGRQDLDNDGMLSWKEFYKEDSPELIGLAWELFQRYDRNRNNQLELNEFEFRYNPAKLSPELFFKYADKDKNGKLTFTEIFTDKAPEKKNSLEYQRFQIRQARAEDKFVQDDRNNDRSLDVKEFLLARQAATKIAERHRRAVGRTTTDDGSKWLFPVIMSINIILLIGVAVYFLRRKVG